MLKNLKSIMTMMCLLAITTAWAAPVSESQACSIATQFMANHALPASNLNMVLKAPRLSAPASDSHAAYYVFNANRGGYVIVAGDDRAPAVLGYSENGTFDCDDVPEAMQELLKGYAAQIEAIEHGAQVARHLGSHSAIAPLVSCAWSQRAPYNMLLPYVSGRHAYVGCVATALAQVLYYWKWPTRPTAPIPAYTTETRSIYMPELPAVDFDWASMHDTYETSDTLSVSGRAAGTLSLYCAQSVKMDYKTNSSSAYTSDIPDALINYFGYKTTVKSVRRQYFGTQQWEELIYAELAARRPIIYRGSKDSGGHAFICDGYDGNGMYHINWGWNGASNGYFLLNVMNPDAEDVGSADGASGYILDQGMVLGIEPGTSSQTFEVIDRYIEIQGSNLNRTSQSNDFTITVHTHFLNSTSQTISFDYGWGLYNGNTLIKLLQHGTKENLGSQYYTKITETLTFGSGITSGNYYIKPVYSEVGANNWRPCLGSEINYIEVIIHQNSCEATIYGSSCDPDYTINSIDATGFMHPKRPVRFIVNMTNNGRTRNDLVYMFVNGSKYSSAFIDVENGKSENVEFIYLPDNTGSYFVTFALEDNPYAYLSGRNITISEMPLANLTGQIRALNVTDAQANIITSDKFGLQVNVQNNLSTAYDEDITVNLYKHTYGNYGTLVQTQNIPISLQGNKSTRLYINLDNVMDGWSYFTKVYYYSEGSQVYLGGTGFYMIEFPETPSYPNGDVNGDLEVNIADANAVISIIQGNNANSDIMERADVNGDGEINIADVNSIIRIILN